MGKQLEGLEDYPKKVIAVLLENEKLVNEQFKGDEIWKKYSLEMVRKVYDPKNFLGFDWVNVQPMLGPCSIVRFGNWNISGKILWSHTEEIVAKTRSLKQYYNDEFNDELYSAIANEFNREILTDLKNNVGTIATRNFSIDGLVDGLSLVFDTIAKESWRNPEWLVTSPEAVDMLEKIYGFHNYYTPPTSSLAVYKIGILKHLPLTVYKDPLFHKQEFLMGYKGGIFDSQYIYAPYVPFNLTAPVIDPNTFLPHRRLMIRYGKKLTPAGRKFFGKVILRGF